MTADYRLVGFVLFSTYLVLTGFVLFAVALFINSPRMRSLWFRGPWAGCSFSTGLC
jgi:hypothetical protein